MKVELKELILLYITIAEFISYVPQICRMVKRKSAEDVSISSWCIWTLNSALYLMYLLLDHVGIWLIITQALEVMLVGLTLVVAVILRLKNKVGR